MLKKILILPFYTMMLNIFQNRPFKTDNFIKDKIIF